MKRIFIAFLSLLMASMLNAAQFRDVKDISGNVVKVPVNVERSLHFGMRTTRSF